MVRVRSLCLLDVLDSDLFRAHYFLSGVVVAILNIYLLAIVRDFHDVDVCVLE